MVSSPKLTISPPPPPAKKGNPPLDPERETIPTGTVANLVKSYQAKAQEAEAKPLLNGAHSAQLQSGGCCSCVIS